ncbi:hypothetical protein JVU11DRAFT_2865 [Chiua virens]|nr:hypothetical protein JVU11DRAFT_2865 [Chiua virens]
MCGHPSDVEDALFSCTVFNAEQNPSWRAPQPFLLSVRATSLITLPFSSFKLVMSKKAVKNNEPETNYAERDIVLGKVRGYPPWPAMVMNLDSVPSHVAKERPGGKKTIFHCVRFFPAGDYAWLVSKDISRLKEHEIRAYISEPHKKNADLLSGYRIALDPTSWEKERETLDMAAAEQEDNAPVDQLETENEEEEEKKPTKSKKRKRDVEAPSKPKAKPKQKAEKKVAPGKSKKNGAKSKELIESEDDGDQEVEAEDEDAGTSAKAAPPPSKKPKREKEEEVDANLEADPEARKVREWRHKLQKALLGSKGAPSDEDMPALDHLFSTVEQYEHPNLINFLSFSKIGKVMRHIAALTPDKVPRDEEYKFRTRAKALVDKWHAILGANKPTENGVDATANGAPADAPDASEAKASSSPAQNAISAISVADMTMSEA